MTRIEQVFVDLNLVKDLKKNKMVEVIHKGKITTWRTNITISILNELNTTIKYWSTVPPLNDIWIYYRSQNKGTILEIGMMHFHRQPRLPLVSASPIYGVPRFLRCTCGLSQGVWENWSHNLSQYPMTLAPSSTRLNQSWMSSCGIGSSRKEFTGMPATLRITYPMCLLCLKRHCIYVPRSQTHWKGSKRNLSESQSTRTRRTNQQR